MSETVEGFVYSDGEFQYDKSSGKIKLGQLQFSLETLSVCFFMMAYSAYIYSHSNEHHLDIIPVHVIWISVMRLWHRPHQ